MKKLTKLRRLITNWADARADADNAEMCGPPDSNWQADAQLALQKTRKKLDEELEVIELALNIGGNRK